MELNWIMNNTVMIILSVYHSGIYLLAWSSMLYGTDIDNLLILIIL